MKRDALWPAALVAVLGITVVVNLAVLTIAQDRNAAAVEPDYYRKAVKWDSTMAEEQRDRELGWRIEAEIGITASGFTAVAARLTDRAGAPILGARIRVTAIHNLDATHPRVVTLESGPGARYRGTFESSHRGLWELRFEVRRGSERFTETLRLDAAPARGAR